MAVVAVVLGAITLICYWPLTGHAFINFDDPQYITKNPRVTGGLSLSGIIWAFTSGYACNWHPVTWLSHMLDCQLFGLNPGWHHFANLLFHAANSILLLVMLHELTGSLWRSAFVAALFAWHPLHVESVAWASERKDVLSTFFWLLTMIAYVRYVRRPSRNGYLAALLLFALGLMSKPMLVTLPCVLLLVDFWPLRRLALPGSWLPKGWLAGSFLTAAPDEAPRRSPRFLVYEKLPFFALAFVSSAITFLVQRTGGAVSSLEAIPFGMRLGNALQAYAGYISKSFWPVDLVPIYPYPSQLSLGLVLLSGLFVFAVSAWFLFRAERNPYLIVGWLWFLGTLVPTIGLIQVGSQSMADRYMYVPAIGLFIAVIWGMEAVLRERKFSPAISGLAGSAVLAACLVGTSLQLRYWHDAETLFRHTLQASKVKYIAYNYLGKAIEDAGRKDEALSFYLRAVQLKPGYAEGEYNVGTLLMEKGKMDEAVTHFLQALKTHPRYAEAHDNLGSAYFKLGRRADAKDEYSQAVALAPGNPEAHYNLGTVLLAEARFDEAAVQFSKAIELNPDYASAHANLGVALMNRGQAFEGISHFLAAVRLNPTNADAQFNLGLALYEHGKPVEAVSYLQEALKLVPDSARNHYYLAVALARQNNTKEAAAHAEKARSLALASGQSELAAKAQQLLGKN
jgi:tetratricopeptide (TPR) repeat protein